MKNLILQITLVFALSLSLITTTTAQQAFNNNTTTVQAGVGLGGYGNTYSSQTPIISVAFEKGIKENLGPGNLGIGAQVGFKSARYHYNTFGRDYGWNYRYIMLAGRAVYHPHFVKSDKFDAYVGLSLGLYFLTFDSNDDAFFNYNSTHLSLGGMIGCKYFFNEHWAAYAELGYGLGYLNVGAAYKF